MHAARQAEPGHGTAVATTVLGSGTRAAGVAVQGANMRGALLGLTVGWLWRLGGGEKAFGIVTENEASPLPLNKALRKLKSLWSNFAIIAKSVLLLQIKTIKRK